MKTNDSVTLPITVLIGVKNEEKNLAKCLASILRVERIVVVDSESTDSTARLAADAGAEVVQFRYAGGYPKKRQWALDTLSLPSEWILLLDADEVVPEALWDEIKGAIAGGHHSAFFIEKGFHFLGRKFKFGGFSHSAVLLFRKGTARFEELHCVDECGLDMEVHERVIVEGSIGQLRTPLVHEDFKGLTAYLDRHNKYSTWEASIRNSHLQRREWGPVAVRPRLLGNTQERRRSLKQLIVRIPGEPLLWFLYHYLIRLGFLEGRPGWIASVIRMQYISNVRGKLFELRRHSTFDLAGK